MSKNKKRGLVALNFILAAILWPETINSWLELYEKTPDVEWYHGILLTFVPKVGKMYILFYAITWVAMKFLYNPYLAGY